ncbi:MAG TPA: hypothetical protein VF659_20905 [Pyrinomonadaceae bacterium]|jgi:hypothetical protein
MPTALKATLLLCALAAAAAAQGDAAPGLAVSGFEWRYEGYAPFEVVRSEKTAESVRTARGTDYVFKYASRLTVKNSGPKAFKSIEWAHVFSDPETGKELKRYRLQAKGRVAAGEAMTVSKAVFVKPGESTSHLRAGRQRVEVTRVEYEDGTAWRAAGPEGRKP